MLVIDTDDGAAFEAVEEGDFAEALAADVVAFGCVTSCADNVTDNVVESINGGGHGLDAIAGGEDTGEGVRRAVGVFKGVVGVGYDVAGFKVSVDGAGTYCAREGNLAAIVGLVTVDGGLDAGEVVFALGVALGTLEGW